MSIDYQGKLLLNTQVKFDEKYLSFSHPKQVLKQLINLKKHAKTIVYNKLSKPIEFYNKNDIAHSSCYLIKPKDLAVILDAQNYKANLCINPKYLTLNARPGFELPEATAGMALTNAMNLYIQKYPHFFQGVLRNSTNLSYQNHSLLLRSNISSIKQYQTDNDKLQNQFGVDSLSYHGYFKDYFVAAGMLASAGSSLISGTNYMGVSVQNFGIVSNQNSQSSQVIVYLQAKF